MEKLFITLDGVSLEVTNPDLFIPIKCIREAGCVTLGGAYTALLSQGLEDFFFDFPYVTDALVKENKLRKF